MQTRFTALGVGVVIVALGLSVLAPAPRAHASDTGKVIAALAVGALVYGIMDSYDHDRCYPSHGYHYRPDYYYRGYSYGPSRTRRAYHRGYNDGFDDGYTVGWHDGRRVGQREGYSWGYRDGDRHGKAVGYRHGYRDGRQDQWVKDRYGHYGPPRSTCGRPGPWD